METLRSQPYRLFFPLGAVLGGIGVAHWMFYALKWQESYSGQTHALIQFQAFLMAFACGFMMTMVPRRTQTAPASTLELVLPSVGVIAATLGALRGAWIVAETGFLLTLVTMTQFAVRRFLSDSAGRKPPNAFLLIPIGLFHGVLGAVFVMLPELGAQIVWATQVGRGWIQEGMFLCITLGIGNMVLPLVTGYDVPPDAATGPAGTRERLVIGLSGLVILLSFPLQYFLTAPLGGPLAIRLGYGLRLAVVCYHLFGPLRAYRWPRVPGLQRRLLWLSFWCMALGLGLVVAFPLYRIAMLHVLFVGGFGLMTFAVGCHVILAHGGFPHLVGGSPWQVATFALLTLLALATRVSADFVTSYFLHLGIAAGIWLVALVVWVAFLVPKAARLPDAAGTQAHPNP